MVVEELLLSCHWNRSVVGWVVVVVVLGEWSWNRCSYHRRWLDGRNDAAGGDECKCGSDVLL